MICSSMYYFSPVFFIIFLLGADYKLLIISDRRFVGHLPGGHEVFKVEKVAFVTLAVDAEFEIDLKVMAADRQPFPSAVINIDPNH